MSEWVHLENGSMINVLHIAHIKRNPQQVGNDKSVVHLSSGTLVTLDETDTQRVIRAIGNRTSAMRD